MAQNTESLKTFLPPHATLMVSGTASRSAKRLTKAQSLAALHAAFAAQLPAGPQVLDAVRRDLLEKCAGGCQDCKLARTRTQLVVGEGNPKARLMFIGEGPGESEDLSGRPFVGRGGQLLTKMIEAMGLTREDVFIANVVKCRPPENRDPEFDEIIACSSYLLRQIEAVRPEVIVTLGKFASQTVLQTQDKLSDLRGKFHSYRGIALMPTLHPAYLLRNPPAKKEAWEDLQQVMAKLGLKPKPATPNAS